MQTQPADEESHLTTGSSALERNFGMSVGVAALVMSLLVTYDILTRTLFAMSNSWVMEMCEYLSAYMTFGGAAYALKTDALVKVDIVVNLVSPGAKRMLGLVSDTVMFVVVALLAWLSFEFWRDAWTTGEKGPSLLAMPFWIPYLFFVLGMFWLLLALATQLLAGLKRRKATQIQGNG